MFINAAKRNLQERTQPSYKSSSYSQPYSRQSTMHSAKPVFKEQLVQLQAEKLKRESLMIKRLNSDIIDIQKQIDEQEFTQNSQGELE